MKRLYSTLWMNNVFFTGLGIIGLFFVAIQYAAQAGWSVGVKRIATGDGNMDSDRRNVDARALFSLQSMMSFIGRTVLYIMKASDFDKIISKKAPFFFWPLGGWNVSHYSSFSEWCYSLECGTGSLR